ncbi:LysR family transcriptional regulator [Massilia niabensis]|uniref:LysR substrate-binding domain-containing protein n=1 Tax=Massilia niabensis TaxID=544910 RepID=A0ABW0LAH9_9BURK
MNAELSVRRERKREKTGGSHIIYACTAWIEWARAKMDKLLWMHCFVRAVETGSFSAVARELQIGQPNVSRHIASLERLLDTRLLHRSTRQLAMTQEGQKYYAQARHALDVISQAESDARGEQNPHGLLRVACAESLGTEVLMASMPEFLSRYPDVQVELRLGDNYIDLIAEGVDIAVRGGALKDSAFRARRVGTSERICVASKAYLAAHGAPAEPPDLLHHECVIYTLLGSGGWPFKTGEVHVGGRLRLNSLEGIRRAVSRHMGIGYLPSWMVAGELERGELQAVLTDYTAVGTPLNALYAAERLLPQRASVFIEFISSVFSATRGLNGVSLV